MRSGPETLLIVSQFFWPEPIGTPRYVTDFASWLAAGGHDVEVLTGRPFYPEFRIPEKYQKGKCDREVVNGVKVRRLPTFVPKGGGVVGRLLNEVYYFVQVSGRVCISAQRRADHVFSFCPSIFAAAAAVLATRTRGRHVAVVYDIQSGLAAGLGMISMGLLQRLLRGFEAIVLNRSDGIIVLSERMKECLESQGVRKPIWVLPIWVDTDQINPLPRPKDAPPVVMYSGNIGRKQGVEQVLAMARLLGERRPNVRVLIRGQGLLLETLRQDAAEQGLHNVVIEPLVPEEQLNESLAEGDVHLIPQLPDAADYAVPSKIYGILAAGRPFICTAEPDSALWRLKDETGACLCTPPNDAEALCTAVIELLDDPERCQDMGVRGRAYAENTARRDVVLSRYLELMRGQLQPASSRVPGLGSI